MKRKILLSVISVVFCMFMFAAVCSAEVSGDYTYTVADGKATITGFNGTSTMVTIPSAFGDIPVAAIGGKAFAGNTTLKSVTVPASITAIGDGAFEDCDALVSVTLKDGLLTIGNGAFLGCDKLSTVTIPKSVTSIGDDAFAFCAALSNLKVTDGNAYFTASNYALFSADMTRLVQFPIGRSALTSFDIPSGVTTIDTNAFYGAQYLTSVTVPATVANMSSETFVNCPALTTITVDAANAKFSSVDGNLFNKAGTVLMQYAAGKTAESYTVPSGVTVIDSWAFGGCNNLKSVIIADTVDEIGYAAFANCEGITSITIPGTATVGELAFGGCTALESVEMTEGVVSIGMAAFSGCTALSDITIPASLEAIGGMNMGTGKYIGAFGNCPAIENLTVSADNAYFSAVDGSLFNKNATEIIKYATGKTDATYALPETVKVIASEAFAYDSSLESIVFPGTLTTIDDDAFKGCSALTSVDIPEGVTYIGLYAFADCAALANVTIPESVNFIGAYAFAGCTSLETAKVRTQTPVMGANIFRDADSSFTVRGYIGSSVEEYAVANSHNFMDVVYVPAVTVNKVAEDVVVSAPQGDWSEGTNTFTVSSETACVVLVSYDDGETYTRLDAQLQPDGSYAFTADNVADGVIFVVTKVGDVDCNGELTNADATVLKAAVLGKISLDNVKACIADMNGDGKFSNADVTRLKAMHLGKIQPKW